MANSKISELTALTTIASGDLFPVVDVSDTTHSADGTTKKITYTNIVAGLEAVITSLSNLVTVGTLTSGNADAIVSAASTTVAGKIEVAIAAEVTTGTDATRAVSPDTLAGSDYGKRIIGIQVFESDANTTTGDGKAFFRVPSVLNGWNIVAVSASVYTAGTTNTTDIQLRNKTQTADILSTKMTIDTGETDTSTAATPAVINANEDDLATGDIIAIDVDAVSSTPAKGLYVEITCQLP